MTATLNGLRRSFVTFGTEGFRGTIEGAGCDGQIYFSLPSLAPGTYSCPDIKIAWFNQYAGPLEGNNASSQDCCTVEITRSGGPGEFIEGTFSGILIHSGVIGWIKIENGHFAVIRR
jgi:hypothetical protein